MNEDRVGFKLQEQAVDCEVLINREIYSLAEICRNKKVVDIGCGNGFNRTVVESMPSISYPHFSPMGLEFYTSDNNMKLEKISGGASFGIDYQGQTRLYPLPSGLLSRAIAFCIRSIIRIKSWAVFGYLLFFGKESRESVKRKARLYFTLECLKHSAGLNFIMKKK